MLKPIDFVATYSNNGWTMYTTNAEEYKSIFSTLFAQEKFEDNIEVAPIGCGNMIDYWGLVEALDEIRNSKCHIKHRGVDTTDWNYKIKAGEQGEVDFTKANAATI